MTQVIFPLQGVFEVHRGRESATADAASAVIFEAGSDHRVGHPTDHGDRCLVLVYPQETVAEALEPGSGFGGLGGVRDHAWVPERWWRGSGSML